MKRLLIAFALACVLTGTAFAGEMPGDGKSVTGSTSTTGQTPPALAPGDMPGIGFETSSETESNLVGTVLLTLITLIGR